MISIAFRVACIVLGILAFALAGLIDSVALGSIGLGIAGWTLGYLWGEADAYWRVFMERRR